MSDAFITIEDVYKRFAPRVTLTDKIVAKLGAKVDMRPVRAVDGVSLRVERGKFDHRISLLSLDCVLQSSPFVRRRCSSFFSLPCW